VIEVLSLLVVIGLYILIMRVATLAMVLTGLSEDVAKFQVRSAFMGVGFTTSESESVVNHPVRRRIVQWLIFTGNAGIISALSLFIATVIGSTSTADTGLRIFILILGLVVFWLLNHSKLINQWLTDLINAALHRWTSLNIKDYARLLDISGGYEITEISVADGKWLCDRYLSELKLPEEGVLVLGLRKPDGRYLATPPESTQITSGSKLILYGREENLLELASRKHGEAGDAEHLRAVEKLKKERSEEA